MVVCAPTTPAMPAAVKPSKTPSPDAAIPIADHLATGAWRWQLVEVVWIFLIFFLLAGSPPPDVGESHYLVKAKHFWDPSWCQGDMFVESRDAHVTFCWTLGWITKFTSLSAAAWILRGLTWLALAWSWQRLSFAVAPCKLGSLLTAGLMLLFLRCFHMAGEWIVGGVEAKGPAYVFLFLALEALVRGKWDRAWLLVGASSAFHVLVGGWSAVALAGVWFFAGDSRPGLVKMLPAVIGGGVLALPGVVPALLLTWGIDAQTVREGTRIYVFERLPHHLVFHRFETAAIVRFGGLVAAWLILAWFCIRKESLSSPLKRLQQFVAGALAIGLAGAILDQALVGLGNVRGMSLIEYQSMAAPLLKYYWFRMSDAMIPIGLSLGLVAAIMQLRVSRPALSAWALIAAMLAAGANLAEICYARSRLTVPGAFLQPRPTPQVRSGLLNYLAHPSADEAPDQEEAAQTAQLLSAKELFEEWRSACLWIKLNTPQSARFLTPRRQQTFKWYAERAEVATWKDVPQDPASAVIWRSALTEIFPPHKPGGDLDQHGDARLVELAHKYGATYIVLDMTRTTRPVLLPKVYPDWLYANKAYAVYRVPAEK